MQAARAQHDLVQTERLMSAAVSTCFSSCTHVLPPPSSSSAAAAVSDVAPKADAKFDACMQKCADKYLEVRHIAYKHLYTALQKFNS